MDLRDVWTESWDDVMRSYSCTTPATAPVQFCTDSQACRDVLSQVQQNNGCVQVPKSMTQFITSFTAPAGLTCTLHASVEVYASRFLHTLMAF